MEFQEIDIYIDKDGQVKIEVRGVKGQKCLDLTKDLEMALGGKIEARDMTSEYHEQDVVQGQTWQHQKTY